MLDSLHLVHFNLLDRVAFCCLKIWIVAIEFVSKVSCLFACFTNAMQCHCYDFLPGESKKARYLLERNMKIRFLTSKLGIVFSLRMSQLRF